MWVSKIHHGVKALAALGAVVLTACTSHSAVAGNSAKIYYSDARYIQLIEPQNSGISVEENQLMTGSYGEKKFSGESWMLLNDTTVHMMLFSSMGNTIAELVYTKDSLAFNSKWMNAEKMKPEYIIADIQFCYYPASVLQKNFDAAGFTFVESQDGDVLHRTLFDGKTAILKMEKRGNKIVLQNLLRHYSYQIESEIKE